MGKSSEITISTIQGNSTINRNTKKINKWYLLLKIIFDLSKVMQKMVENFVHNMKKKNWFDKERKKQNTLLQWSFRRRCCWCKLIKLHNHKNHFTQNFAAALIYFLLDSVKKKKIKPTNSHH